MIFKKYTLSSGHIIEVPITIENDMELEALTDLLLNVMISEEDNRHNAHIVELITGVIGKYEDSLPEVIKFIRQCKLHVR